MYMYILEIQLQFYHAIGVYNTKGIFLFSVWVGQTAVQNMPQCVAEVSSLHPVLTSQQ